MAPPIFSITRIPIDGTGWTPITLPVSCHIFWFRCDDSKIRIRTDSNDAMTEDIIAAGTQFVIPQVTNRQAKMNPRFIVGDTICYVQSIGFLGGGEEDVILTAVLR